ncbi:MAG TPA: hypothetical protein VNJ02_10515 [Vicinamibacterales bacterium]|nr:hypothetical protein [Vicinamibacterales bacterium]
MTRVLLIALLTANVGCAPSVIEMASKIPHHQATYEPTEGDSMQRALDELLTRVRSWGFEVTYVEGLALPSGHPIFGRIDSVAHQIELRTPMPVNATFEVLAHELGHLFGPPALDRATGQVFAELVGVGIAAHYGYSSKRPAATYLAAFKHTFPSVAYLQADIDFAVKAATGQVPVRIP